MRTEEALLYSGGAACALHLRAEQAYRLRVVEDVPDAANAAGVLPLPTPASWPSVPGRGARMARLHLGLWSDSDKAEDAVSAEDLGVCLQLAALNVPKAAPSLALSVTIATEGNAVETIKFSILSPSYDSRRPLSLRGRWVEGGAPLPGPPAMCLFVHPSGAHASGPGSLPAASKRPPSARELRFGAYEAVAKRHRDFPPPPLPGPAGPPPRRPAIEPRSVQAAAEAAAAAAAAAAVELPSPEQVPTRLSDVEEAMAGLRVAQKAADDAFRTRPAAAEADGPARPAVLVRPLAAAVFDSRDGISQLVYRTVAELKKRVGPDGARPAALDALTQLAHVLHELRVLESDVPAPEAPPESLFAMDVLAEPGEPLGEPLQWEEPPPGECGEGYIARAVAAVEGARESPSPEALALAEAALSQDALLLSPLVRTSEGRLRLRALLVTLREAAAAFAPVGRVARRLAGAAVRRLRSQADPLDAVRCAWAAVDALRPQLHNAVPDLHLITLERALRVLTLARDSARALALRSGTGPAGPGEVLLLAEAVARIGGQEVMDGRLEAGIEHLFEAWSLALRAGPAGSPSRLEATIILWLAEAHGLSPVAFQLAERIYWHRETADDLHFEARACLDLALLSSTAGRLEEAQRYLARIVEIQAQLPPADRERQITGHKVFSTRALVALRAGGLDGVFEDTWALSVAVPWQPDLAHPCRDSALGLFRTFDRPTPLEACLDLVRFGCYFLALADPNDRTPGRFFAFGAIGEVYGRMGHWRLAAQATREALRAAARFPRVLPPDHPRILRLRAALGRYEERARGAQAGPA